MKFIYKQLLAVTALLSINSAVNASYEFDFSNLVSDGSAIVLRINQRRTDNKDYYQIIPHGSTPKQVFDNAFCLEKISWAPYNPNAPYKGGLDLVDRQLLRVPEKNQEKFGKYVAVHYAWTPIEIKMLPNKVFSDTVKDATNLLKGIDTFTCQVLNTVKDFEGISAAENITKGVSDFGGGLLGGLGESNTPTKPQADAEKTVLTQIKTALVVKNKARIGELVERNMTLLKSLFSLSQISTIRNGYGAMTNGAAINLIDSKLSTLNTQLEIADSTTSTTKNKFDDLFSSSPSSNDPFALLGGGSTTKPARTKETSKCRFGLGRIGDAAGKLAGKTLCKSRQFIIVTKLDKEGFPIIDMRYGRPALQALTGEGE
jgi:hypothetical protein